MIYLAKNWDTGEFIPGMEAPTRGDLVDMMEWANPDIKNWGAIQVVECRGCRKDERETFVDERRDFYGISTGHWCESCYNSSAYPYRRDAYDPYNEYGTR